MKSTRFKTKLILNSQIIRRLTSTGLSGVHGGKVAAQTGNQECTTGVNCTVNCTFDCTGGCRECG